MTRWVGNWLHGLVQRMAPSGATSMWQPTTSGGLQDQHRGLMFSSIFIASLDGDTEYHSWRVFCYTGEATGMAISKLHSRGSLWNFKTGLAATS